MFMGLFVFRQVWSLMRLVSWETSLSRWRRTWRSVHYTTPFSSSTTLYHNRTSLDSSFQLPATSVLLFVYFHLSTLYLSVFLKNTMEVCQLSPWWWRYLSCSVIGPWLVVVTLAGYSLYTLQIFAEYKTKSCFVRLAYQTWMAVQHVLAIFSSKISWCGTAKYRLHAHTWHSTKLATCI